MSTLREAAQQALEALEYLNVTAEHRVDDRIPDAAITALRAALAQQEQEPSVCARCGGLVYDPVWVAQSDPPRREWRGLTEEEKADILFPLTAAGASDMECTRAIEQACKEKNHE